VIELFSASTIAFASSTFSHKSERLNQQVEFALPEISWTPSDAITVISFSSNGAPNSLSLK
jgi:hypothetical protein